jgi:carbonic anhydrase
MRLMAPAVEKVGPQDKLSPAEYIARLEQANVTNSLDNLQTFPNVQKLIAAGEIAVHGAYFGVATGELSVRDEASGEFVPAR